MSVYLIEYQKQTSFFFRDVPGDNYTAKRKALVSREVFAQMLNAHNYVVYLIVSSIALFALPQAG